MAKKKFIENETDSDSWLKEIIHTEPSEYSAKMQEEILTLGHTNISVPYVHVSYGISGLVSGAGQTLEAIQSYIRERGIACELNVTGSLGLFSAEPLVSVQLPGRARILFKNISSEKVIPLLDDIFHDTIPESLLLAQIRNKSHEPWKDIPFLDELPFFSKQKRSILRDCGIIDPLSVEEYIARGGYKAFIKTIRQYTYSEICSIIEESGLRGRSGSGYLTGSKWKIACNTPGDQKYLICNAEESDPGAFMDRAIMEGNPHLLVEGMAIAAYGIGATKAYIYIRSEYVLSIQRLDQALGRAYDLGIIGHDIFGSGFNLDIIIRKGPGAFVCGEETAMVRSIEGKRGMPKFKPPYPATQGLHRKPTIINNVETLSNVPAIIEMGPKHYKETGVENNYGTKIFAVSGRIINSGLIEVPLGMNLRELVEEIAGGCHPGKKIKAVHIGGPSGCTIPVDLLDVPLSFDSLKARGVPIGSGGIVVLDEETCIPDLAKFYMNFMQMQSCGKCIPCREGTRRMSEILESITKKPGDENSHATLERFKGVLQLESLAEVMRDTSLCGLGHAAPNPVLSSLKYFRDEYEEHIFDRKCRSNSCKELRTYTIQVDSCTGCSLCAKKCPADAIIGTPLHPYFIVSEKCTGCGVCFDACKFNSISFN